MRGTERGRWRWLLVAAYFVATSLGHLRFTQWLLLPRQSDWLGAYAFKDAVPGLLVLGGFALGGWVVRTAWRDARGAWATGGYWLVWLACVAAVDRLLTYSIYEYAHYPQYALLAALIGWAMDPQRTGQYGARILFWATLLGAVDEWMQYLWITPGYGNYLDFNDFLVNLLGAAAGVMLYGGNRPVLAPARVWRREARVSAGLVLVVIVAFASGRLQVSPPPGLVVPAGGVVQSADGVTRLYLQRAPGWYGSAQNSPHRGAYHVLSPQAGLLALLLAGGVFAGYSTPWPERRRRG